ncbi:MAG TPA: hypothetical protein VNA26_08960 [Chitinophagaceae bacterium]|nr:hypothetical protein [Chitinophagaceae bacterium]
MQKNFINRDFEDFLKRSSDSLFMRPSDRVWKGISKNLHQRRRRIAFATGTFLMIALFSGFFLMKEPKDFSFPLASANAEIRNAQTITSEKSIVPANEIEELNTANRLNKISNSVSQISKNKIKTTSHLLTSNLEQTIIQKSSENILLAESTENPFIPTIVDSYPEEKELGLTQAENKNDVSDQSDKLLTIESVTNVFKAIGRKKSKLDFQFFFTPTVSYCKLSENKAYLNAVPQTNAAPNYAALYDINNVVTHRPNMGLELGLAAKYPVAKNIKLRGGVQFNLSGYDIKSFTYTPEVAILALNSGFNQVDYVGTVTTHRNFSGGQPEWLKNFYLQVSAPVGFEVKLLGNSKTSLGIASTVQPTYILGDRAYLLSTDYKNYTEVPYLIRRWNVNTNLETFISYSTGKMNWQVGPQVRYQLLSSYVDKYPVKENLFDFGLKVGVSINSNKTDK